jgi:hypothetical protein
MLDIKEWKNVRTRRIPVRANDLQYFARISKERRKIVRSFLARIPFYLYWIKSSNNEYQEFQINLKRLSNILTLLPNVHFVVIRALSSEQQLYRAKVIQKVAKRQALEMSETRGLLVKVSTWT